MGYSRVVSDIAPATPPQDPAIDAETAPPVHPGDGTVQYKGAPLEAERGPGLGCFYSQLVVLAAAVIITPLSVVWGWPEGVSAALLILVLLLLLLTGQTVIFLLRLVAADRRATGRRRPLGSATRTVGELEDERAGGPAAQADGVAAAPAADSGEDPARRDPTRDEDSRPPA